MTTVDVIRVPQLTDGELTFYRRQGYLPLPGLLPPERAASLDAEVMATMEAIGGWEKAKLLQSSEYLAGGPTDELVHSAALRDLAALLMQGPASVWLPFTAVKGPQGGRFHFHQDNNYTRFDGPGINIWFALRDMGPENGCLQVVPGSHLDGDREAEHTQDHHRRIRVNESDFVPMRMRAGDAVAFSRLTIHGSGPNTAPGPRVGYAVQFYRDDVRYPDKQTGEPVLIRDKHPYAHVLTPVDAISVPTGRTDGH